MIRIDQALYKLENILYYLRNWHLSIDVDNRNCNSALLNLYWKSYRIFESIDRYRLGTDYAERFRSSYLYTARRFQRLIRKAGPYAKTIEWRARLEQMGQNADVPQTLYALVSPSEVTFATSADLAYVIKKTLATASVGPGE